MTNRSYVQMQRKAFGQSSHKMNKTVKDKNVHTMIEHG